MRYERMYPTLQPDGPAAHPTLVVIVPFMCVRIPISVWGCSDPFVHSACSEPRGSEAYRGALTRQYVDRSAPLETLPQLAPGSLLREQYEIVALAPRSHGETTTPITAESDIYVGAAELAFAYKALDVAPCPLFAPSTIGSRIALAFAILFPNLVTALALASLGTRRPRRNIAQLVGFCEVAVNGEDPEIVVDMFTELGQPACFAGVALVRADPGSASQRVHSEAKVRPRSSETPSCCSSCGCVPSTFGFTTAKAARTPY